MSYIVVYENSNHLPTVTYCMDDLSKITLHLSTGYELVLSIGNILHISFWCKQ